MHPATQPCMLKLMLSSPPVHAPSPDPARPVPPTQQLLVGVVAVRPLPGQPAAARLGPRLGAALLRGPLLAALQPPKLLVAARLQGQPRQLVDGGDCGQGTCARSVSTPGNPMRMPA